MGDEGLVEKAEVVALGDEGWVGTNVCASGSKTFDSFGLAGWPFDLAPPLLRLLLGWAEADRDGAAELELESK